MSYRTCFGCGKVKEVLPPIFCHQCADLLPQDLYLEMMDLVWTHEVTEEKKSRFNRCCQTALQIIEIDRYAEIILPPLKRRKNK